MSQNTEFFVSSILKLFIGIKAQIQQYSLESKVVFSLKNIILSVVLTKKGRRKKASGRRSFESFLFKKERGM